MVRGDQTPIRFYGGQTKPKHGVFRNPSSSALMQVLSCTSAAATCRIYCRRAWWLYVKCFLASLWWLLPTRHCRNPSLGGGAGGEFYFRVLSVLSIGPLLPLCVTTATANNMRLSSKRRRTHFAQTPITKIIRAPTCQKPVLSTHRCI